MEYVCVELEQTGAFSGLFLDYIRKAAPTLPFYNRYPNIENFEGQIKEKSASFENNTRALLTQSLKRQYAHISDAPLVQINSLANSNTFTVTTGHQLNIFTGPLYFIYKIATAVNLAKELKKAYPHYHFVPVYWMATEDHDFEEIRSFRLFGKKFQWEPTGKTGGAVGRMETKGLEAIWEQLPDMPALFKEAYTNNSSLANATREIVHRLFGDEGLVVVDGDDALLKSMFAPMMNMELDKQVLGRAASKTTEALEKAGYSSQIFVRDINLFYLDNHLRERIEVSGDGANAQYSVVNTDIRHDKASLLALLDAHPERFSPNVVLRPLYQEVILPNIAYIGGPAEVAYWLQLKGIFDAARVPFPMVMPRNFALVIGKSNKKKMEKLGLSPIELFEDIHKLKNNYLQKNSNNVLDFTQESTQLDALFESLLHKADTIDRSLLAFIGAEHKKTQKVLEHIEAKIRKSEERVHETAIQQLVSLKDSLFPDGGLQERKDNLLNFYINDPAFIQRIVSVLSPLDYKMFVLME